MIPGEFHYHQASSVDDAVSLLNRFEDAKIVAGGHSLLPMMKLRMAEPAHLIDLNGLSELKQIKPDGDSILIGAMCTENELIRSELLQARCPLIVEAAGLIADPQVRSRATIGGDIAHGDPGNDHPALMLATDAEFIINGPDGERTAPANGFFLGTYWTGLEESELLTAIRIPAFTPETGYGFNKIKRKTGDYATAGATVVLKMAGGRIKHIRIALTNVAPMALRAPEAEQMLLEQSPDQALLNKAAEAVMQVCDPVADLSGDVRYKTAMAAEMTKRSLGDAVNRAGGVQ